MKKIEVVPGERYGRLIIKSESSPGRYGRQFECKCDCGKIVVKPLKLLLNKHVKSCGCFSVECAEKMKKELGRSALNQVITGYRNKAAKKGLIFTLSEVDFERLIRQDCFYCGSAPGNRFFKPNYNGDLIYSGIDRFNNSLGYITENCVPCCATCNKAKRNMSGEEFVKWLSKFSGRVDSLLEYVEGYRPEGLVTVTGITDKNGDEIPIQSAVEKGFLTGVSKPPAGWDTSHNEASFSKSPFNLFLDQGRQLMCYAFGFRSPISDYTAGRFGVGTGTTTPATTDVTLESPILLTSVNSITAPILGSDFLTPFVVRVSYQIALGDANGYLITERGLFSGNGTLFARHVSSAGINKTSDFSPTLTWRIRF